MIVMMNISSIEMSYTRKHDELSDIMKYLLNQYFGSLRVNRNAEFMQFNVIIQLC